MRAWLLLIGLTAVVAIPGQAQAQPEAGATDPAWVAQMVGRFAGTVLNAGKMECHYTTFSLQDGHLVGHYRIQDDEPFEGELTNFVPGGEGRGTFTWTDRYGVGVEFVIFAADYSSFTGAWGNSSIDPRNPVFGTRGGTAGCANAVS